MLDCRSWRAWRCFTAKVFPDDLFRSDPLRCLGMLVKDVKPENFMVDEGGRVYFIDFGLMERVSSFDSISGGKFEGTPTYASVAVHEGSPATRHDDIESLGWVLLAIARNGTLPWSSCKSDAECRRMKRECDLGLLTSQVDCEEIGELILHSRQTPRNAAPEYSTLRNLLEAMRQRPSQVSKGVIAKASTRRKAAVVHEVTNSMTSPRHLPSRKRSSASISEESHVPYRPFSSAIDRSPVFLLGKRPSDPTTLEHGGPFTSVLSADSPPRKRSARIAQNANEHIEPDNFYSFVMQSPRAYIEVLEGPRAGEKLPITASLAPGVILKIGRENADVNVHDDCISETYNENILPQKH